MIKVADFKLVQATQHINTISRHLLMSGFLLSWDGPHHPDLSHHSGIPVGHVTLLLSLEVFLAQRRLV